MTETTITEPGLYANMPEADYHADPYPVSLSSTVLKALIEQTPAQARLLHPRLNPYYEEKNSAAFDLGSAVHCIVLQDEPKIEVLDFKDWRTKDSKEAKDQAYKNKRVPMLQHEYDLAAEMADAFAHQMAQTELGEVFYDNASMTEVAGFWEEDGFKGRLRLDRWAPHAQVAFDFKSTGLSADPRYFPRNFRNLGYDLQAAYYLRGLREIRGGDPTIYYLVQETKPPFLMKAYGMTDATLSLADEKIEQALPKWKRGIETGEWPGYGNDLAWMAPPDWAIAQWEREKADMEAAEANVGWYYPRIAR